MIIYQLWIRFLLKDLLVFPN